MNEEGWVGEAKLRILVLLQCVSLEHVEFFLSLLHVLFCQCVLYYVLLSFSVLALSCTSISPDPIVVPKQNLYHVKPDGEGSCRQKMEKI